MQICIAQSAIGIIQVDIGIQCDNYKVLKYGYMYIQCIFVVYISKSALVMYNMYYCAQS